MIFSEIYGEYFNAVAKILDTAVRGELNENDIISIVGKSAFGESILSLPQKIKNEKWGLLTSDLKTPIKNKPQMPLTDTEKRWLRAVLNDPRVKLFDADIKGLENAEPLYSQDMFVYFDRYNDGDPYNDERYIRNFKTVLKALREKRKAVVKFRGRTGKVHNKSVIPYNIEYSPQDDKFRLQAYARHTLWTINIARIEDCKLDEKFEKTVSYKAKKKKLVIELIDERNALERAMLHFSHLEKKTEKVSNDRYKITLYYDKDDETKLLIRVLAFGPVMKVTEPESFIEQIKQRLRMQNNLKK